MCLHLLLGTFLLHLFSLSLCCLQSLLVRLILHLLQLFKRDWNIYILTIGKFSWYVAINSNHGSTITIISEYFITMFCSICINGLELSTYLNNTINDTSSFFDSLLLGISHSLTSHFISILLTTQFSKHRGICMLNRISSWVIIQNHIITITNVNRTIFMGSNITIDDIYTIIFQAASSLDGSISDCITRLVCVHVNRLCCSLHFQVYLVSCVINHTFIASSR